MLRAAGLTHERSAEQRGNYSEADASFAVFQMLNALDYLHRINIVHRDLKPENLLYADNTERADLKVGRVFLSLFVSVSCDCHPILQLADFGLAAVTQGSATLQTMCGTPGYVAPEVGPLSISLRFVTTMLSPQVLLGKPYGAPVDEYAVGVILYILLSGMEPFYEEDDQRMFRRIMRGQWDFSVRRARLRCAVVRSSRLGHPGAHLEDHQRERQGSHPQAHVSESRTTADGITGSGALLGQGVAAAKPVFVMVDALNCVCRETARRVST